MHAAIQGIKILGHNDEIVAFSAISLLLVWQEWAGGDRGLANYSLHIHAVHH